MVSGFSKALKSVLMVQRNDFLTEVILKVNSLESRQLILITLLGTVAFVSTGFLPSPFDKIVIVFQALALALGSLIMPRGGATSVALINGALLTILRSIRQWRNNIKF